ncbi:MAG TPA: ribulose-phosphate 3-epimerase [Gaiellaceae bacterium]|jgi:ribulose-phosphate 3-epimerase|nr:ribulose-phosphate 3-epimerase [Gaiellaceae bacterium]
MRPIPRGVIAPSLLSCDFSRLAEQVELVMDAGAMVMHFDAMDGQFVPPITIGPLIAESISELVHDRGGILDCHLMVDRPERQVEAFAKAGADVITIHPEATPHIHYALQTIRAAGCAAGVVINPGSPVELVEPLAEIIDLCLVMSVNPGWGGQRYIPTSTERLARLRTLLPPEVVLEVDGGISLDTIDGARDAGTDVFVAGSSVFGAADPAAAFKALAARL